MVVFSNMRSPIWRTVILLWYFINKLIRIREKISRIKRTFARENYWQARTHVLYLSLSKTTKYKRPILKRCWNTIGQVLYIQSAETLLLHIKAFILWQVKRFCYVSKSLKELIIYKPERNNKIFHFKWRKDYWKVNFLVERENCCQFREVNVRKEVYWAECKAEKPIYFSILVNSYLPTTIYADNKKSSLKIRKIYINTTSITLSI